MNIGYCLSRWFSSKTKCSETIQLFIDDAVYLKNNIEKKKKIINRTERKKKRAENIFYIC